MTQQISKQARVNASIAARYIFISHFRKPNEDITLKGKIHFSILKFPLVDLIDEVN